MAKTPEQRRADKADYMRRQRAAHPEKYKVKSQEFVAHHRDRLNSERNARYEANKTRIRAQRHGTTVEVLTFLWGVQRGLCAICSKTLQHWPSAATHIDHCHDTGKVRGILCRSCNMKEGWVRRYGVRLKAYLENPPAALAEELS